MLSHATLLGLLLLLVGGGVGLPFPEDVTLIGAGVLAQQGVLRLPAVIAVGLAGVAIADWLIYLVGRRYGADLVSHPRLARLFGAERLESVREAVARHGARAVFFARFLFGFRIVTFLAAGTFEVSAPRFALAEAAGTGIFVPATATLGFLFAHQAERVIENVGRAEQWIVLVGLAGLAIYLGLRALAARTGLTGEGPPRDTEGTPPGPPPTPGRPT
ncbi:MAG TPA: DedA family protein [Candidatus Binatia bacterium]|nr:DedA family protein [Candidatus Binatia bacterium]